MSPMYIFNVASQHNRWLTIRQATIAGNIANANTPGFKAQDVAPFETALESARLAMTANDGAHMQAQDAGGAATVMRKEDTWETTLSGNSVSLEQELIKSSDVSRAFKLNTSVVKAFHRMLLASAKV
jgi:flagellar basal-body rod protein FlgB